MGVKVAGAVSPNVLIVGAVSGFALYLLWSWTRSSGGASVYDRASGAVTEYVRERNEEALTLGEQLPFSPFWWVSKIKNLGE